LRNPAWRYPEHLIVNGSASGKAPWATGAPGLWPVALKRVMFKHLNIFVLVIVGIIFQVNVFPAYLADPFKPNVLLVFVVFMGLRAGFRFGALSSFLFGLVQDTFSGLYFGLNAFSYLLIFTLYHEVATRLYTGSRLLMILCTFLAVVLNACVQYLLLLVFSSSEGAFSSIFAAVFPQGLTTALVAASLFFLFPHAFSEEYS
nr:rod shape-determining protein MreD [Geobacteraceae bacterium]